MTNDLTALANTLNERRASIKTYRDYYDGSTTTTFVGSKLQNAFGEKLSRLNANRCSPIINTIADRLEVVNFTGEHEDEVMRYWRENDLDLVADELHAEALTTGNAFVIVLPDSQGTPRLYPQWSEKVAVLFDAENHREIRVAAKTWRLSDGRYRLNLIYADRIEKWVTTSPDEELPTNDAKWEKHQDSSDPNWPLKTNFDRVPVFMFANNARSGCYGRSELEAIIPLQDRLNLSLANQALGEEFSALRQRWAVGISPIIDETGQAISPFKTSGAGELWMATDSDVKFGDFEASDLEQFERVIEGTELRIARTAGIPIHYLLQSSTPSGEALRTAESRLVSKVTGRQINFGVVWSQIMEFVMELQGIQTQLKTVWKPAETRSEVNFWTNAVIKHQLGVSNAQILREAGYTDAEIERFAQEREHEADAIGDGLLKAFNAV